MRKGSEKEIHFLVMANAFDSPLEIHEQYDLKGSTVGRHVKCEENQKGEIALKDNDFRRRIRMGPQKKALFLEQVEDDIKWLEEHGLCDYSLLVGYHFRDSSPLPEKEETEHDK
jgi:1-phosphatidylinositol-4-phosphate 5-kinase